jgi:signal transduction histidine kinase
MSIAEMEARRQLELDLHDGAQERLVLAALTLRRAVRHARGTAAERLVAEALQRLQEGVAELHDLARRVHPYALTQYGLATALEGLAARIPLHVELRVGRERLEPVLDAAIYSTVAEALANAAEHAATRATVTVSRAGDTVVAEIVDDGVGVAGRAEAPGCRRPTESIEALSGRLELDTMPGGDTRVRAVLPVKVSTRPTEQAVLGVG